VFVIITKTIRVQDALSRSACDGDEVERDAIVERRKETPWGPHICESERGERKFNMKRQI
jgi:hypothetical protein